MFVLGLVAYKIAFLLGKVLSCELPSSLSRRPVITEAPVPEVPPRINAHLGQTDPGVFSSVSLNRRVVILEPVTKRPDCARAQPCLCSW